MPGQQASQGGPGGPERELEQTLQDPLAFKPPSPHLGVVQTGGAGPGAPASIGYRRTPQETPSSSSFQLFLALWAPGSRRESSVKSPPEGFTAPR